MSSTDQQSPLPTAAYDPKSCQPGIIHVGVGAFHRAHQAAYIDQLLALEGEQGWGIVGVNLRPQESSLMQLLKDQDYSYFLKTMAPTGEVKYRQINSILGVSDWAVDPMAAANIAAGDNIHLITVTVTESGYYLLENSKLDTNAQPIVEGLSGRGSCIYTYLRAALNARRADCNLPITILCCDNLRHNGKLLQTGFEQFLQACGDTELLAWLANNATFPCSMVDRITPRMDPKHAQDVRDRFGVNDQLTVMSESYLQWVIENKFAGPMPDLSAVGAEIVTDVEPYEEAKIRILNGAHTVVCYMAALKGHVTYDQAILDPELEHLFMGYETDEVIPAMAGSSINLVEYRDLIKARFSNINIADSVARITADGVSKFPIFILPTLEKAFALEIMPSNCIKGIASWYVFMRHVAAGKIGFDYLEPKWDFIQPLLSAGAENAFATNDVLWGKLPVQYPAFVAELQKEIVVMSERFR